MKKIIALLLCSATSYSFGLNMPLKPSVNSLSQSWNNLSFTSRAMIIAASAISIIYAAWPISEENAEIKASVKMCEYFEEIRGQIQYEKSTPEQIKKMYDEKGNPAIFSYGSFWNHNALLVSVEIENKQIILKLSKRKILKDERLYLKKFFYDSNNHGWIEDLFNAAMK